VRLPINKGLDLTPAQWTAAGAGLFSGRGSNTCLRRLHPAKLGDNPGHHWIWCAARFDRLAQETHDLLGSMRRSQATAAGWSPLRALIGRQRRIARWRQVTDIVAKVLFQPMTKILRAGGATFANKMRGTSRPPANRIVFAKNLEACNFRVLQHNRPIADLRHSCP
jgi:hypothetical protein